MEERSERPVSREEAREEFQAIKAAIDEFLESDDEERLLTLSGGTMRLTRDPDAPGGVRVSAEGVEYAMDNQTYHAPERPEGYPADVPFVPDTTTIVTHIPGRGLFSATWMMPDDPDAVFDEIEAWHRGAGWVDIGDHPDQEEGLATAREKMAETMRSRGMGDEEIDAAAENAIEISRSARRVRLGKDGSTRGISVMSLPGGKGVITLFAKPPETES